MATLVEMAGRLVAAHAAKNALSTDQLLQELGRVHAALKGLQGVPQGGGEAAPVLTVKEAFKRDEVVCLVCGRGGFQSLGRHLGIAHQIKPDAYRRRFGISAEQSLTSQAFFEKRQRFALDFGYAENLAKARAVRMAKLKLKKECSVKSAPARARGKAKAPVAAGAQM